MTTREKSPTVLAARRQQAESRLLVIRNALTVADEELQRALVEKDWEVFGLASFEDYCAVMLPELQHIKLRATARRARATLLLEAHATEREIAAATRASPATAHRDVLVITGRPASNEASEPTPTPLPPCSNVQRAVSLVAAAGTRGLTVRELCTEAGWHHGQASSALTKAHQRGLTYSSGLFRSACTVYVLNPESLRP